MRTSIKIGILVLALLFTYTHLGAQHRYKVQDIPNVQLQDKTQYVSDPENVLKAADITILDKHLAQLRDSANVEAAIVVLPAIDTESYGVAKDFATELFNTWRIGDKEKHSGLLILLLTADGEREIVFETGYGTEAVLTDALCKLIQTKIMIPFLKDGNYGAGLIAGVEEILRVFDGSSEFISEKSSSSLNSDFWLVVLIWIIIGLLLLIMVEDIRKKRIAESNNRFVEAINYKPLSGIGCAIAFFFFASYFLYAIYKSIAHKDDMPRLNCDKCGAKRKVVLNGKPKIIQKAEKGKDGLKQYSFICKACKYEHILVLTYKYVAPPPISTGGSSSSRGGSWGGSSGGSWGGSSGGSWGGGMSGGGGASTKF